jgi:hypothetical protein
MDSTNKSESARRSRQEPLGALALCLVFPLMALPELLWTLHRIGLVWLDRVVWAAFFVAVLLLLVTSRNRIHRDPNRWHGGFVNILTACMLALNALQALVALHYHAL